MLLSLIFLPLGKILGIVVAVGGAFLYGKYYQTRAMATRPKPKSPKGVRRCSMKWTRLCKKLTRKSRLATLLACLTILYQVVVKQVILRIVGTVRAPPLRGVAIIKPELPL
jgi:hypothetical protein